MEKNIELHYNKYIQEQVYERLKSSTMYINNTNVHIDVYKDKLKDELVKLNKDFYFTNKSDCFYDDKELVTYSIITAIDDKNHYSVTYTTNSIDNIASDITILYDIKQKDLIIEFINVLTTIKYVEEPDKDVFYMVGVDQGNFILNVINVIEKDINIISNYGHKFALTHNEIAYKLTNKTSGHLIVYGDYNLGKTHWIKQLIRELCNEKTVIYVPSYLTEQLSNPEFVNFLERHIGAVVIYEDAENVFTANPNMNMIHPGIANILNLTSGILNDITQLQMVLTFNTTDKKTIDKSLFRNGILIGEHKFEKLSAEDATKLSKEIDKNKIYTKATSVSDVYDGTLTETSKKKQRVGFKDQNDN